MITKTVNLLTEAENNDTVSNLNSALNSVQDFSQKANGLLAEAEAQDTINRLNSTLISLGGAAEQIQVFMAVNQGKIADTVASIGQASKDMSATLNELEPIVAKMEEGQLLENLDTISANAVDLTTNLRDFSAQLNDPATMVQLQRLLDSARFVFENVNKITSEIDEITGDPQLRQDLIRLIRGLSNLVSSTQQLQQQLQYAQVLNQVATEIDNPQLSNQTNISSSPSTSYSSKP